MCCENENCQHPTLRCEELEAGINTIHQGFPLFSRFEDCLQSEIIVWPLKLVNWLHNIQWVVLAHVHSVQQQNNMNMESLEIFNTKPCTEPDQLCVGLKQIEEKEMF